LERLVRIVEGPIDLLALDDWIWDPSCGAEVKFLGKVRNHNHGRKVIDMEYRAYTSMAVQEINYIVDEAAKKWAMTRCAVIHRTGKLKISDVAVAIYVSSVHREEAFMACPFIISELKRRVPLWKKEQYEDGTQWLGMRPC